jgi:hypothetical protein
MRAAAVVIALVAATGLAAVGFLCGTYAAGGSDSSCYALMANAFASGRLQPSSALASQVPWPDASQTFAPGGFVASQSNPAAASPVCAPGFSLLLAPVVKLGGSNALFGATPMAGAMLVWLAFLAGRALAGPAVGAMSAVLVATSPTVLYQVVQPMNDVTTTALWMGVFVALISRRWAWAGICGGLALLVRPNLVPLAAVAGWFVLTDRVPDPKSPIRRVAACCLSALPFLVVILWLNAELYGGPLRTGYGSLGNLFSPSRVPRNAAHYLRWLIDTQTIFPLFGLLAPFVVAREKRPAATLAFGLIAATAVIYFAYTPFDDWSYLRFLMPAVAFMLVLASLVTMTLISKLVAHPGGQVVAAGALTICLAVFALGTANSRLAFSLQALEQRYRSAGIVARDRLPSDAALLTVWDSGAIRFHAGKEAVIWDGLDPSWLDRALEWLEAHGHPPYILLESWEEPKFRERFATHSTIGNLDWPPRYEVDRVVRIYDPQDRARYIRGDRVLTEYLWPFRRR